MKVPYLGKGAPWGDDELSAMRTAAAEHDSLSWGASVVRFERQFAEFCGVEHALAVRSCTAALFVGTRALGIQQGDEVITTPLTFIATVLPLLDVGAKIVFADIDPVTLNIDPADIERKITERTRAIYVVHYAGQAADMDAIMALARRHDLKVLEDAAHAPGATYKGKKIGSIGDVTCFSFQSLKNMTCHGEGGMLTTNDAELADRARTLQRYGNVMQRGRKMYGNRDREVPWHLDVVDVNGYVGGHYRMGVLEAAAGAVQIEKLAQWTEQRRRIARQLNDGLRDLPGVTVPEPRPDRDHVYHLYPLLVDEGVVGDKDELLRRLIEEEGIEVWLQYCPLYLFTLFRRRGYQRGLCPVCEDVFLHRLLNLPIHPQLTPGQIDHMIEAVRRQCAALAR